jgi:hypothetical protein
MGLCMVKIEKCIGFSSFDNPIDNGCRNVDHLHNFFFIIYLMSELCWSFRVELEQTIYNRLSRL